MRFDRPPRHGQAQANSLGLAGDQWLENAGCNGRWRPGPVSTTSITALLFGPRVEESDFDAAVRPGRFSSVADDVEHHVSKLAGVAVDFHRCIRRSPAAVRRRYACFGEAATPAFPQ